MAGGFLFAEFRRGTPGSERRGADSAGGPGPPRGRRHLERGLSEPDELTILVV